MARMITEQVSRVLRELLTTVDQANYPPQTRAMPRLGVLYRLVLPAGPSCQLSTTPAKQARSCNDDAISTGASTSQSAQRQYQHAARHHGADIICIYVPVNWHNTYCYGSGSYLLVRNARRVHASKAQYLQATSTKFW